MPSDSSLERTHTHNDVSNAMASVSSSKNEGESDAGCGPETSDSSIGLLSLSNEVLMQIIDNLDLTPCSDDATTIVYLALTSRRLYNIVLTTTNFGDLKSLCPKPKGWWFLPSDYKYEVQERLIYKAATRGKWRKAVPYLRLITKLQEGSMEVMERQGYVFDSERAVWIIPQGKKRVCGSQSSRE